MYDYEVLYVTQDDVSRGRELDLIQRQDAAGWELISACNTFGYSGQLTNGGLRLYFRREKRSAFHTKE